MRWMMALLFFVSTLQGKETFQPFLFKERLESLVNQLLHPEFACHNSEELIAEWNACMEEWHRLQNTSFASDLEELINEMLCNEELQQALQRCVVQAFLNWAVNHPGKNSS